MEKHYKIAIIALSVIALLLFAAVGIGLWIHYAPTDDPQQDPPAPTVDPATVVRSPQITDEYTYDEVSQVMDLNPKLPVELLADGYSIPFDETEGIYYLSVADDSIGTYMGISFSVKGEGNYAIAFQNTFDQYSWFKAENNRKYNFRIYDDFEYATFSVVITTMPFLSIETEGNADIGNGDRKCKILLRDGNWKTNGSSPVTETYALAHIRGASSTGYPKKAYKLNLKTSDDYATQNKISLLGLRNDDDWILDAMYIDPTRMHNKLATEIWNEMTAGDYPGTDDPATQGKYVEVIINGTYVGLYDLIEPVDRKQLGLDEEEGVLIKANNWNGTYFDKADGMPDDVTWMDFEMTYPKEDIEFIHWVEFFDLLTATVDAKKDPQYFDLLAKSYLSAENITDYWLLLSAFQMRDNRGKNLFWSNQNTADPNSKFYITPWDCDCAFGYRWYGTADLRRRRDDPSNEYIDDFKLLKRYLQYDVESSRQLLCDKWDAYTAQGGILSPESVYARAEGYYYYLEETGAWERETDRWEESMPEDPEEEFDYMRSWLIDRCEFVGERVNAYRED